MVNAWSLAASILNGTFEKDYPIMKKKEVEHSDAYYDYKRNDSNAENPFTDPVDRERADVVVGGGNTAVDKDLEWIESGGGFDWAPDSPWPPSVSEDDGLDYDIDLSTIDDQYSHHFTNANSPYNDGWTQEFHKKQLTSHPDIDDLINQREIEKLNNKKKSEKMNYEPQRNHQYKYHEQEILKDIEEYVSNTYNGHYTGTKHEFRKVQTIDLMAARDIAAQFCQANILKYGSRYGSKNGRNKTDLMKVIHYAMLLLHFDGHYGEPSMPSGNFEQMP